MNARRIISYTTGLFAALLLVYWILVDLYPIEPMEYRLVEQGLAGWYFAPVLARLVLGLMFLVAAFLVLGINPRKLVTRVGTLVLLLMLFDLAWELMANNIIIICYGCAWPDNMAMSILIIGLLSFWMILFQRRQANADLGWKWVKYIAGILAVALPFILNPVYPQDITDRSTTVEESFDTSLLPNDVGEGDVLVGFMSTACRFCKEQARKITVAKAKNPDFPEFQVLFLGTEKGVGIFKDVAGVDFPHAIPDEETFIELSGHAYPVFAYVKQGKILKRWTGATFNFWAVANPDKW